MDIAKALRATSSHTVNATAQTFEGLSYGASAAADAVRKARGFVSKSDVSNIRDASRYADDLNTSLDSSAKSASKLSQAIGNVKQNLGAYLKWAAVGGLVSSALRDLSEDADRVVESYYSMGESMARTRKGMHGLIKDTWNLSLQSGRLQMAAARMNMPAEAALHIQEKLMRSTRAFFGPNGKLRYDLIGNTAMQVMAFARITGASVEQSTDLLARLMNQYGKSPRQAVSGLQAIARAGQMVNEELHDMGKDGGVALEDMVGLINDASGAFDGFTLNVEHLAARVSHAVKIGQELGMTYNQAADTAKQMTSIFAKPGGYIAFQAGEQLRQDIESTLKGLTDTEDRAKALSQKYGINVAQGRTLDIAAQGPNAQMNVMEELKGTTAGMEKQFDLMQEQARNNSLSLDVFKQFVGGENLSAEQSGDLMQMLKAQNGSFKDWQRHLDMSKKDVAADKVIDQSVFVPTMAKEWIKATSGAMKLNIAAGIGIFKGAITGLKFAAFIAIGYSIIKAIMNLKQVMRNVDGVLTKWFGDKYVQKKELLLLGLRRAKQEASGAWTYMRSGTMFRDLKSFFHNVGTGIGDLVRAFRNGSARVTVQNVAGNMQARGGTMYQDLRARGGAAYGATREYAMTKAAAARVAAQQALERAQASYSHVSQMAQNSPLVLRRRQAVEEASAALARANERSRAIMSGVTDYAITNTRGTAAAAKRAIQEQARIARNLAAEGTASARRIATRQRRLLLVAERRAQIAAAEQAAVSGGGGGGGLLNTIMSLLGLVSMTGAGGAGAAGMADMAMSAADVVGMAGGLGGGLGGEHIPEGINGRKPGIFKRGWDKLRGRGSRIGEIANDVNGALAPATKPLARASGVSRFMHGNIYTDLAEAAPGAVLHKGGVGSKLLHGGLATAASFGKRNLGKAAIIAGIGAVGWSAYQGFRSTELGEENTGENGETQRAGGRRYDKEIESRTSALEAISKEIDIAQAAGNKDTEALLQKQYDTQSKVLKSVTDDKETLDAADRKQDEIQKRIDGLIEAKKYEATDADKKLDDVRIARLKQEKKKLEEKLHKKGVSSTSDKSWWDGIASMGNIAQIAVPMAVGAGGMALRAGSWLAGTGPGSKLVEKAAGTGVGKLVSAAGGKLGGSVLGRLGGTMAKPLGSGLLSKGLGGTVGGLLGKVGGAGLGGLITAFQTEGDWKRKLFAGAVTGLGDLAAGAAGTALAGPAGGFVAGAGANWYLSQHAAGWYDKLFGDDSAEAAPPTVLPDGLNSSMAGSQSDLAARGVGTVTNVGKNGKAYMQIEITNFDGAIQKQQTYSEQRDSGLSGG